MAIYINGRRVDGSDDDDGDVGQNVVGSVINGSLIQIRNGERRGTSDGAAQAGRG